MSVAANRHIPHSLIDKIIDSIKDSVTEEQKMAIEQKLEELTPACSFKEMEKPVKKIEKLHSMWEKNRRFFREHEDELQEKYPGLYVAVHDNQVVGTGEEIGPLVGRIYREQGFPVFAAVPGQRTSIQLDVPVV